MTDGLALGSQNCEITSEVIKCWITDLKTVISEIADNQKWFINQIHISETALAIAFAEIRKDCHAIVNRRNPRNGVSIGKIAGIVTFRLVRFAPFQISEDLLEDEKAIFINIYVAIAFSLRVLLGRNISEVRSELMKELVYTLSRRHTNQETLGMVFEFIDLYGDEIR